MSVSRSLDNSILREYDIRGIVGETLFAEDFLSIGHAFGNIVSQHFRQAATVVVGYDGRLSSPNLFSALLEGLLLSGVKVINVGLGPSPMVYFATYQLNAQAGMVVTGSHNPPSFNGVKMIIDGKPFYGKNIQLLGARIRNGEFISKTGVLEDIDIRDQYVNRLLDGNVLKSNIKVAWDPANGASGEIVEKLIGRLGGKHILINSVIDGNFPNHHPDPTVENNLLQLKEIVSDNQCDLGIGFDGDGDRIGVVDSKGRVLRGDQLLIIWARDILKKLPGSTIIADVKTSSIFYEEVKKLGGIPFMWKTGHSLIKSKMAELNAPLAGEMSGHIFFSDEYYGFDDAIYASLRLLRILNSDKTHLNELRDSLPFKFNTPELRFDCSDEIKFAIVDEVCHRMKDDSNAEICDIDGIRVQSKDGWWLLRASNTQPVLVARCESNTEDGLLKLKDKLKEQLILSGIEAPNFN